MNGRRSIGKMSTVKRVIPLLVYKDIAAAHDFLVKTFGFEAGGVERTDEGRAIHGEVRAGDTTIWLHRVTAEHELDYSTAMESSGLVVFVDNVDEHYKRVRASDAHIDSELQDMPYGQREYGVHDMEGHRWWFATPLSAQAEAS
jgi:uncharacterized glyoxalase superfamily protein PhnB